MKRLFLRVLNWNTLMGIKTPIIFTLPSEDDRELATDLICEEANELLEAETKEDILDALADCQFTLFGAAARYGIKFDEFKAYFKKVCDSNDSKFCDTEDEAKESVISEADRLDLDVSEVSYFELDGKFVVHNVSTGKVLKSINYKAPENI